MGKAGDTGVPSMWGLMGCGDKEDAEGKTGTETEDLGGAAED